jgi:hypothetical protein
MDRITETLRNPIALLLMALAVVLGAAAGVLYGYYGAPVVWTNQTVSNLRQDLREDYMRMTIDSFRVNGDINLAIRRYQALDEDIEGMEIPDYAFITFQAVKADPKGIDPAVIVIFEEQLSKAGVLNPPPPDTGEGEAAPSMWNTAFVLAGGLLAVVVIGAAVFYLFRSYRRSGAPLTPAQQAAELSRTMGKTEYAASDTPPVAQYVTTYVIGDDLFDDSFSIDSQAGEFLGECGVGISETIGVGDPKKVTAFEVWMFDKNDIQTVTKVLMSNHAYNDPNYRGKLESKGELVIVEPHKQVVLETQTLQMVVTVMDLQYGQGALPDKSYFERITLELAIWPK